MPVKVVGIYNQVRTSKEVRTLIGGKAWPGNAIKYIDFIGMPGWMNVYLDCINVYTSVNHFFIECDTPDILCYVIILFTISCIHFLTAVYIYIYIDKNV